MGRTVNFKNTILIMTSNLGARLIEKRTSLGFQQHHENTSYGHMNDLIHSELKRAFNPEFINRLDDTIIFHMLTKEHIGQIVDIMINELNTQLKEQDMVLRVLPEAKEWLIQKGYDPAYGARPLRRVIQRYIEDMLAEEVLKGRFGPKSLIDVTIEDDTPAFIERSPATSPKKENLALPLTQ
jgi:ATP-dependent Clp protease ATP-binding subunit ClpC